ncbi:hypothetical protein WV31_04955 [Magnetospirillum sp. ME-1]|uniref:hypothetical protein n=1 Tax=Magnetospirillum sp. ME-1 TaxID=1639348 RepID=UPI000A17F5C9|nr:hypothetical protein [Magnetospirillum sp. ME-1]ARJ65057.1 hypothetical protein WV31_04955 [Magnetospirillum sp. ME-1]
MTKKNPEPKNDAGVLRVMPDGDKSHERLFAEIGLSPVALNAYTSQTFGKGFAGDLNINECIAILGEKAGKVRGGDTSDLESMLVAQATALDAIFMEMARRAALNMGAHLQATETYMRLALKAQSQARCTVETISEIKNPRAAVAFVKQANITSGPQQVNNGVGAQYAHARAGAENLKSRQSKLLEHETDGEWLDTRTAGKAGGSDKEMAPVGKVHRPQDR